MPGRAIPVTAHPSPSDLKHGASWASSLVAASSVGAWQAPPTWEVVARVQAGKSRLVLAWEGGTLRGVVVAPTKLRFPNHKVAFNDAATDAWIQDAMPAPKNPKVDKGAMTTYAKHFLPAIQEALAGDREVGAASLVGYGMGGVVATIAALHLAIYHTRVAANPVIQVITLGSPRPGNVDFRELLDLHGDLYLHRVVRTEDALVAWPASQFGYAHAGYEINMDGGGNLTYCSQDTTSLTRGFDNWAAVFADAVFILVAVVALGWGLWWHGKHIKALEPTSVARRHHVFGAVWLVGLVVVACAMSAYALYSHLQGMSAAWYAARINEESPDPGAERGYACTPPWAGQAFVFNLGHAVLLSMVVFAFAATHHVRFAKPIAGLAGAGILLDVVKAASALA